MMDFRAFNDLDIPCINEIIISLVELDNVGHDDSYSIRVPCNRLGPVTMELKLAAFTVTGEEENIVEVDPTNIFDMDSIPDIAYGIGVGALNVVSAIAENQENNAVYSFEMEVVKDGKFDPAIFGNPSYRAAFETCGSTKNSISSPK